LLSASVAPDNAKLPIGVNRQYALIGNFSDGITQDFTTDPATVWSAPTPSVVTVMLDGRVTGIVTGTGAIDA
jgi:hypothetical protein